MQYRTLGCTSVHVSSRERIEARSPGCLEPLPYGNFRDA